MKVFIVLMDYGQYDGGAVILAVYKDKEKAEQRAQKEQGRLFYPEFHVMPYEVE